MQTSSSSEEVVVAAQRSNKETVTLVMAAAATTTPTSSSTDDHSTADDHQPQPLAAVVKRKQRTKRPRHHHPPSSSASVSSSESTTTEEEDMAHCLILLAQGATGAAHASVAAVDSKPSPSPSPAAAEDQKQAAPPPLPAPPPPRSERYTSRKYTEAAATADGVRAGFYVYECKTCNKCFPTFQALGGHRASHKKPRLAAGDTVTVNDDGATNSKAAAPPMATTTTMAPPPHPLVVRRPPPTTAIDIAAAFPDVTTALSLSTAAAGRPRVHECSICRAEFASGQALGGHMRRHRPLNAAPDRVVTTPIVAAAVTTTAATGKTNKEAGSAAGINLELDLNLPAPPDEEAVVSSLLPPPPPSPAVMLGLGQFNDGNKAGLMLTASPLVGCHY